MPVWARTHTDNLPMPMTTVTRTLLAAALLALALMTGCSPEVGDSCLTATECGTAGICDTSSPDGYCTITPCSPNSCPQEAVCVEFENSETYCMRRCESNGDCRSGYACRDDIGPVKFCYIAP